MYVVLQRSHTTAAYKLSTVWRPDEVHCTAEANAAVHYLDAKLVRASRAHLAVMGELGPEAPQAPVAAEAAKARAAGGLRGAFARCQGLPIETNGTGF